MLLLCRTKVHDYDKWWQVFASHAEAHRAAGLKLVNLWRCVDDANHVFLLFEVKDQTRAQAFIDALEPHGDLKRVGHVFAEEAFRGDAS